MTTLEKIIALVAAILLFVGTLVALHYRELSGSRAVQAMLQAEAAAIQKAADLQKQQEALVKQARDWETKAASAEAKSAGLEVSLAAAKAALAALPPQPAVTPLTGLPSDLHELAAAFAGEGFPPLLAGASLAFAVPEARPMLGLLRDGKAYPLALTRIEDLQASAQALEGQKIGLTEALADEKQAVETQKQALVAADGQKLALQEAVSDEKGVTAGVQKQLSAEKPKKWLWGAGGLVLGFLIKVILVAL